MFEDFRSKEERLFLFVLLGAAAYLAVAAALTVLRWVWRIAFPTIWIYPWPNNKNVEDKDKDKIVLMAGSFNPPHLGHVEMIRYLASRYGRVIVVVGHNPNKVYAVTPQQRAELLETCLKSMPNVSVRTVAGYIWRHVPEAELFFRGIRSWEKDGAEERHLQILNTWGPIVCGPFWWPRPTYFLQGNPKYNHISSTLIREITGGNNNNNNQQRARSANGASGGGYDLLAKLLPESIVPQVRKLYSKQSPE